LINVFSQHRNCKTGKTYTGIKNNIGNFKSIIDLNGK